MAGLRIMDTTIRDGQQSLWATRMTTAEMLPILPKMDQVGYWAIEAWGGATFDSCLRFLDEDPLGAPAPDQRALPQHAARHAGARSETSWATSTIQRMWLSGLLNVPMPMASTSSVCSMP